MTKRSFGLILTLIFVLGITSCNLPMIYVVQQPEEVPLVDSTAAFQTSIAQSVAQTLSAGQGVINPQQPAASVAAEPSLTPTVTLTNTPSTPRVSVSQATYCRTGPGTEYALVTTVNVGQSAEVIAKDPFNSSWYIRNPNMPSGFCWLWGRYATVTGSTDTLPVYTPPPTPTATLTPTPPIDFTAEFTSLETCGGAYAPTITITNIGSLMWDSVQIIVTDTVTSTSKTHVSDDFTEYAGCAQTVNQDDLTAGEPGGVTTVSNPFPYDPSGNAMQAKVKVCSQEGMTGTCMHKTITFTP